MIITLDITDKEAAALTAGVVEHFHKLKDAHSDTTYGALINDESVLVARAVWEKVEEQVGLGKWS
jgi:CRISPR/Cas system CSM-associated protein Csm4 (group 5 of RAMP superfamily)